MIRTSPHPPGRSFALTFVDDTDLSTRENTEPVYRFLAECGFWGTKTVWPLRAKRTSSFRREQEREDDQLGSGSSLQDPDYASFICDLKRAGFEIALHGVSAGNSTRPEILAGLEHFRSVLGELPQINAFHRTNIENLYCGRDKLDSFVLRLCERLTDGSAYEGHREGSPSFWGDVAFQTFRYVRLPFHTIDEVNTLRVNPSMPFYDPLRPHVRRWFAASDGADVVRFNRLLSEANIRRLASQRGVCVIYTHFAKGFARRQNGRYVLDPVFSETVKRITSNREVWIAPASTVLDRLEAVKAVSIRHQGRLVTVTNSGPTAISELVLLLPPGLELRSAGGAITSDGPTVVVPNLPSQASIELHANRDAHYSIEARPAAISRRERKRIEYLNYLGLVRGWYRDRRYYAKARSRPY